MAAFERVGRAYLDFARTEPAYYSAMFEAGIPLDASPELHTAGDAAFAVLRADAEKLIPRLPTGKRSKSSSPERLVMMPCSWLVDETVTLSRRFPVAPQTAP